MNNQNESQSQAPRTQIAKAHTGGATGPRIDLSTPDPRAGVQGALIHQRRNSAAVGENRRVAVAPTLTSTMTVVDTHQVFKRAGIEKIVGPQPAAAPALSDNQRVFDAPELP